MHPDLRVQRRVLVASYTRYMVADREWTVATQEARSWFPAGKRPTSPLLGDPGSRVRRLYEARERALQRLLLAREKLERARLRLAERRRRDAEGTRIYLLTC
ncbi:hypothetical protein [Defluviimonas salinarum]|uniref:Transposase n=1 Tax=Defluviimonas salinarum TaxID=2992147 RepID=A0ABT3J422_9RHOB|nr:hypothetical protein [Defluviimonas salinarum]MCW3782434.1 hypothetical protein [Defluviimonas salinarum]